jgi:hypothetical protein
MRGSGVEPGDPTLTLLALEWQASSLGNSKFTYLTSWLLVLALIIHETLVPTQEDPLFTYI